MPLEDFVQKEELEEIKKEVAKTQQYLQQSTTVMNDLSRTIEKGYVKVHGDIPTRTEYQKYITLVNDYIKQNNQLTNQLENQYNQQLQLAEQRLKEQNQEQLQQMYVNIKQDSNYFIQKSYQKDQQSIRKLVKLSAGTMISTLILFGLAMVYFFILK